MHILDVTRLLDKVSKFNDDMLELLDNFYGVSNYDINEEINLSLSEEDIKTLKQNNLLKNARNDVETAVWHTAFACSQLKSYIKKLEEN